LNGAVITEFPKVLDWVTIQMSSNLQVSLELLKQHVKVVYEHDSRTFTISAPSNKPLGEKMTGTCGITSSFIHKKQCIINILSGKCGKNSSDYKFKKSSLPIQTSSWRLQEIPKGLFII
jgi:hypothetical protein